MIKFICNLPILLFVILMLCTKGLNEWVSEPIDSNHVSWVGSQSMAADKISIVFHGWKIIKNNNDYEIGFRVKLFFKEYDKITSPWDSVSIEIIPIKQLLYRFYDSDNFIVDSIILENATNALPYNDTTTFQMKKKYDKSKSNKIDHGEIQILAGYP